MSLKLELGKFYRTRGGGKAEVIKTDFKDPNGRVYVGVVSSPDHDADLILRWLSNGKVWSSSDPYDGDIVDVWTESKPKVTGEAWLWLWNDGSTEITDHKPEEFRKQPKNTSISSAYVVAAKRICTITEGEFDEP